MEFLPTKGIEYLLVIGYLLVLVPFWWLLFSDRRAPVAVARAHLVAHLPQFAEMFRVPDGVMLHPGHAWARVEGPDLVAIGVDDFAQQLVGPIDRVSLPTVGARVHQGAPALGLRADSKLIPVLSPVSGRVVAVNAGALHAPHAVNADPYGDGWLLKVRTRQLPIDSKQLVTAAVISVELWVFRWIVRRMPVLGFEPSWAKDAERTEVGADALPVT